MLDKKYLFNMYEKLQWCSDIELGISSFFPIQEKMIIKDKIHLLQICLEFTYRAIKCGLLNSLIELDFPSGKLNSLEHEFMIIANSKIELFESNKSSSCVEEDIWTTEVLEGSDKLKSLCRECDLIGYEEFNAKDHRWMMFIDKVNNIFLENNLALDFEHPLFPVGDVSNNMP